MNTNLKHKDITQKIIGAAFEVHKFLGNGFQEVIYQRALAVEMRKTGLEFDREIEQNIYYKDFPKPIGRRRADFVVAPESVSRTESHHRVGRCPCSTDFIVNYGNKFTSCRGSPCGCPQIRCSLCIGNSKIYYKLFEGVSIRGSLINQFR